MEIDYKKSFEKLVEQVNFELGWAEEALNKEINKVISDKEKIQFYNGMRCAYNSIKNLADELKKGEFEFGD